MSANPYNFTDPVRDPTMFFGRETLLREIVENFCGPHPHSYSLFGGRRFGKTSLLRAVERRLTERLTTGVEPCVIPIYIDLNYEIIGSRGAFFACVIRRLRNVLGPYLSQVPLDDQYLGGLQGRIETEHDPLPLFERAFVHIRSTAFPQVGALQAVLLIDESERILGHSWAPELHSNLRALLSNRPKVQDHLGIKMAGSSHFYDKITEEGSPLRNILLKRLLPLLSEGENQALIEEPTGGVLPEQVVGEIVRQAGGHPFLTQYLMSYLWETGLNEANAGTVREIVDNFSYERDDFEDWCQGIGPVGEQIYALLCEQGGWTKRSGIYQVIQGNRTDIKKALEALSYHGLVRQDRERGFRVGPEIFRAWFEEYKAPPLTGSYKSARRRRDRESREKSQPQDGFRYDAFISYSHQDSDWVENRLLPHLEGAGLEVCVEDRDFEIGLPRLDNIENAVKRSRKTLLVLTPDWIANEWEGFAGVLVQTMDPAGRRRRVLPLYLESCQLPDRLLALTCLDLTEPDEFDPQMKRLVKAIRSENPR